MGMRELVMAAYVAALGLTVALFVAGAAFQDPQLLGEGKMGALFSGFVGLSAIGIGRMLGMAKGGVEASQTPPSDGVPEEGQR